MLEPAVFPLAVRLLNRMGASLGFFGLPLASLRPQALKSRAVKLARLDDFGEDDFEEGLEVLCRSAEHDARLHFVGRMGLRDHITRTLVTRLRRIEARKRQPEVFEKRLVPPLIVLGIFRSGTTFLHRLLSLAPGARPLAMWEVRVPIPGPGPDRRREEAAALVAQMKRAAPGIDRKHYIDVDQPEECMFLLDSSLKSMGFWAVAPVYGYLEWYLEQDQRSAYRAYREHLQLFQADHPHRRLMLKAPLHAGNLGPLLEAVPEAMIVQTHRNPATATISANSLFYTLHGLVTSSVDVRRMSAANVEAFAVLLERNLADRKTIPEGRVYDVAYEALVADPVATVRGIHRHFDLPFDADFEARLKHGIENQPRHKLGPHVYAADDFGITEAQLHAKFAEYRRRFLNQTTEC